MCVKGFVKPFFRLGVWVLALGVAVLLLGVTILLLGVVFFLFIHVIIKCASSSERGKQQRAATERNGSCFVTEFLYITFVNHIIVADAVKCFSMKHLLVMF